MLLRHRNGTCATSIAPKTINKVANFIIDNPFWTTKEYANDPRVLVAESSVNLIIEHRLMHMAAGGRIAISERGAKPYWFYLLSAEERAYVPVRKLKLDEPLIILPGVTDPILNADYKGQVKLFRTEQMSHRSPARRARAFQEMLDRTNHVGEQHQQSLFDNVRLTDQIAKNNDLLTTVQALLRTERFASLPTDKPIKDAA